MNTVNQGVRKLDAMQLVTGQPVYTEDIAPENCLVVKLLRSPHANALVREIDTGRAMRVPGMEAVFTWKDVPQDARRYTQAGQTAPEPSPLDRLVIDRHVRFAGDVVAILAGRDEACVDKAMKLVKVEYDVLEPVLDFRTALDNPVLVHPEENWETQCPVGADNRRNLCAHEEDGQGDIDAVLRSCDIVIDRVYHTKACQQTPMETFRTFCTIDAYGRLHIVSSTQIVFHTRRIVANALHIPRSKIRVSKPRVGGGFGAKQTAVSAVYPAFVTWMTKKPSMIVFSRRESMIAGSPRHEMEMHVRLGADKNGVVRGIDLYTLSNTGAYGEHGPTTVGLSGHKSIPLYAKAEAYRFVYDVVYTNHMSSGAYRGYGATQGLFAVESAVNELAARLGIDPFEIRKRNIPREGEPMPAYYGQENTSCALEACLESVRRRIGWDEKYPCRDMGNGKVRAVGMGMAMQGSGISNVDVGSATLKLNDGGGYTLSIGAADMGTGCDTVLAQIAAETLDCPLENISVLGADTDSSPYDSGSYASSTTYVTGKAVERCALALREKITALAARLLACGEDDVLLTGERAETADGKRSVTLGEIALASQCGNTIALEATVTHTSPISPPPFMVGAAEIELDRETGETQVVNFVAAVDCGTPIAQAERRRRVYPLHRRGRYGHRLRHGPRADRRRDARLPAGEYLRSRRGYGFLALRFRLVCLEHDVCYRQGRGAVRARAARKDHGARRAPARVRRGRRAPHRRARRDRGRKEIRHARGDRARLSVREYDRARSDRDAHLADLTPAVHGRRGRDRAGPRDRRNTGRELRRRRGLRHAHQPESRPRAGRGRHTAGHRYGTYGKHHLRPPRHAGGKLPHAV